MLKKFSDFTLENKVIVPSNKPVNKTVKKSIAKTKVKDPEAKDVNLKDAKSPEPKMENISFDGKVAKFPSIYKPSMTLKLLESNGISKNKLHYIVTESNNSLVIVKYNTDADIKLNEFVNTLVDYYKRNEKLKNVFSDIIVEGTDHYSIIKNIPDVEIGNKKVLRLLNDDLVKLLK